MALTVVNDNLGIVLLGKWLESEFDLTCSEHPNFGGVDPVHTGSPPDGDASKFWSNSERGSNSRHYAAQALDITGSEKNLRAAYDVLSADASAYGVAELFYQDRGIPTPVEDHWDHLHAAIEGGPSAALAKLIGAEGDSLLKDLLDNSIPGQILEKGGGAVSAVGGAAGGLAKGVVAAIFNELGDEGARILLYLVLVLGGAALIYYGAAKATGTKPLGALTKVGMLAATKGKA